MPTSTESARHFGIYLAEPGTPHYDAMILVDMATPATSDRLPHSNADAWALVQGTRPHRSPNQVTAVSLGRQARNKLEPGP